MVISASHRRFFDNLCDNLPASRFDTCLGQLANSLAGHTAVICSAGPSLPSNLDAIGASLDKAVVIALDCSWQLLMQRGIVPDFVLTCDPGPATSGYLDGMPQSAKLIYEPGCNPDALELATRRIVIGVDSGSNTRLYRCTERLTLPFWGCVASMGVAVAICLGCNPIITLGQDFAYYDLWSHAEGSPARYKITETSQDLIKEFDADGDAVFTTYFLRQFRDYMNFQVQRMAVINGTGKGIFCGPKQWPPDIVKSWLDQKALAPKRPLKIPESNWCEQNTSQLLANLRSFLDDPVQHVNTQMGIASADAERDEMTDGTPLQVIRVVDRHGNYMRDRIERMIAELETETVEGNKYAFRSQD